MLIVPDICRHHQAARITTSRWINGKQKLSEKSSTAIAKDKKFKVERSRKRRKRNVHRLRQHRPLPKAKKNDSRRKNDNDANDTKVKEAALVKTRESNENQWKNGGIDVGSGNNNIRKNARRRRRMP